MWKFPLVYVVYVCMEECKYGHRVKCYSVYSVDVCGYYLETLLLPARTFRLLTYALSTQFLQQPSRLSRDLIWYKQVLSKETWFRLSLPRSVFATVFFYSRLQSENERKIYSRYKIKCKGKHICVEGWFILARFLSLFLKTPKMSTDLDLIFNLGCCRTIHIKNPIWKLSRVFFHRYS